jgi:hypothetical protein
MMTALNDEFGTLLRLLMRGGEYGFYWRSEGRQSTWWPAASPAPIPESRHNWYFGVHPVTQIPPTNSKGEACNPIYLRSQIAYIAALNCLFAEFDGGDFGGKSGAITHVNLLEIPPTAVIDSGGGYHCYWLLDEPKMVTDENREYLSRLQYRWVNFVQSDGGAKDMARVLRIPGTINRKAQYAPDFPPVRLVRVLWNVRYRLNQLTMHLPPDIQPVAATRAIGKGKPSARPEIKDDEKLLDLARNARNGAKFVALFDNGDITGYKSQSEADAALCSILSYWTNGDAGRVDRLFRLSALYRPDKWDSIRVRGATYGDATIRFAGGG